jgi:hypothetical protein
MYSCKIDARQDIEEKQQCPFLFNFLDIGKREILAALCICETHIYKL